MILFTVMLFVSVCFASFDLRKKEKKKKKKLRQQLIVRLMNSSDLFWTQNRITHKMIQQKHVCSTMYVERNQIGFMPKFIRYIMCAIMYARWIHSHFIFFFCCCYKWIFCMLCELYTIMVQIVDTIVRSSSGAFQKKRIWDDTQMR